MGYCVEKVRLEVCIFIIVTEIIELFKVEILSLESSGNNVNFTSKYVTKCSYCVGTFLFPRNLVGFFMKCLRH